MPPVILTPPPSPEVAAHQRARATIAGQPDTINHELKAVPDAELVQALVTVGQPRWSAEKDITHPQGRFHALRLWCDLQDAAEGDGEAKLRIDYVRGQFDALRRTENISDDPTRGYGHILDPRELL